MDVAVFTIVLLDLKACSTYTTVSQSLTNAPGDVRGGPGGLFWVVPGQWPAVLRMAHRSIQKLFTVFGGNFQMLLWAILRPTQANRVGCWPDATQNRPLVSPRSKALSAAASPGLHRAFWNGSVLEPNSPGVSRRAQLNPHTWVGHEPHFGKHWHVLSG